MDFTEDGGDRHTIWALIEPRVIDLIGQLMADQPFYIADGHHRYDSALAHRRERATKAKLFTGEEPYNFVMMSLMDMADPGLVILATHRLVRGISEVILNNLKAHLKSFFDIEQISVFQTDVWQKVDSLLTGITPDTEKIRLAIFGLDGDNLLILTLLDPQRASPLTPHFCGGLLNKLDVSLVDYVIMEQLLGVSKDQQENVLAYNHDRLDAVKQVLDKQYQLAFLMNPVKPELIKTIADAGDRMPRKSTYFYPKSPAGLVFYHW
jgi:uncharacterized protein (DUF1015 family)